MRFLEAPPSVKRFLWFVSRFQNQEPKTDPKSGGEPRLPYCLCSVCQVCVKHRTRARCREQEQRGSALRRSLVSTWLHALGFLLCRTEIVVISVWVLSGPFKSTVALWRFFLVSERGLFVTWHTALGARDHAWEFGLLRSFLFMRVWWGLRLGGRGGSDQFRCVQRKVRLLVRCSP